MGLLQAGVASLVVKLLYGCGLRITEAVRLRVQDIDYGYQQITVRNAKGFKDRVTSLPKRVAVLVEEHLEGVKLIFKQDLEKGVGSVY